jgi:hypothetical protein
LLIPRSIRYFFRTLKEWCAGMKSPDNNFPMVKFLLMSMLFLMSRTTDSFSQEPLWQGKGRIVVSSDGNEHDHDDWAATPLSLAILAAKGLQNKLALYIYSDHIWGSNHEHPGVDGIKPYAQMKESAVRGGKIFRFDHTRFICAVDNPEIAYEALKEEIDKSTSDNPLFIIVAGPVQVIGESIARANHNNRKFVSVVSTLNCWNNDHADKPYAWEKHSGWTMGKIEQHFAGSKGGGLKIISIQNQNPCLMRNWKEYEWLVTAPERKNAYYRKGSWTWLFNRLCMSIKPVSGSENYYAIDASDAGKVVFLLTGVEKTSPQLCYEIMRNPPGSP